MAYQSRQKTEPDQIPEKNLTPQDVASMLGMTQNGLADWRKKGEGPAWFKLSLGQSGRVRYPEKRFYAYIRKMKRTTGSGARSSEDPKIL